LWWRLPGRLRASSRVAFRVALRFALRRSLRDLPRVARPGSLFDRPAVIVLHTVVTPTRKQTRPRTPIRQQPRHSRAAAAARPATPESRYAACGFTPGFTPFTYPNATRMARARFRFDTGHSF